jgi:hypothetical protein
MSSTQSVAGQPVAAPDPRPMHHGVSPSATICSVSAFSSSMVSGFVARILEVLRDVPDQRLHIDLVEEAVELVLAVGVGIGAQIDPGLAGGVVFRDPFGGAVGSGVRKPRAGHVGGQARLREDGDVGGEPASASMTICCSKLSEPV